MRLAAPARTRLLPRHTDSLHGLHGREPSGGRSMGPRALFTQGLRIRNHGDHDQPGLAAALAVVRGRPFERLDLERDAVDGDDPHLLAGRRPASPGWCGPATAPSPTLTTPSGSTASTTSPSSPIIHSRPIVGVANRVRTIDGMPTTNASIDPADAGEQRDPRRAQRDARAAARTATSCRRSCRRCRRRSRSAGRPTWTSTANASIASDDQRRPPSRGPGARRGRSTPGRGRPRRRRRRRRRRR